VFLDKNPLSVVVPPSSSMWTRVPERGFGETTSSLWNAAFRPKYVFCAETLSSIMCDPRNRTSASHLGGVVRQRCLACCCDFVIVYRARDG
jgi:hypothetical protein